MLLISTISALLFTVNNYIWSIVFILLKLFRIHLFKVTGDKVLKFKNNIYCSSIIADDEPYGLIFGKYYIGYVEYTYVNSSFEWVLHIITTKSIYNKLFYKQLHTIESQPNIDNNNVIKFYEREGAFYNLKYNYRIVEFDKFKPKLNQTKIIHSIIQYYNTNKNAIILIYGPINTGKSMISLLLANKLKKYSSVNLIDTFNPTDPGDNFGKIYSKISPDLHNPLIIVIDEIDIIINKLHNNTINNHKDQPIQIKNKSEWNLFFDRFDRKLYPYVIFIMTTNKSLSYFDQLDDSYFRNGRINIKFELI